MIRSLFSPAVLVVLLAVASPGAAAATLGPFLDFDEPLEPTIIIEINTKITSLNYKDKFTITIDLPIHLRGLGYVTAESADFTGDLLITTIYGQALAGPTGLETTGFNPLAPEMTPLSGETFIGVLSETEYPSHYASGPVSIASLPALLPALDLWPIQGDPDSVVYVFQTTVPAWDFPVPEPATAFLLACSGLVLLGRRRPVRR